MRPRPPEYSVDGDPIFISSYDEAWKCPREDFAKDTPDGLIFLDTHPVGRYFNGDTRYRLTPEVMEHLDTSKNPEMYVLQEVPHTVLMRAMQMLEQMRSHEGWAELARYGVAEVRPKEALAELGIRVGPRGGLTRGTMDLLVRQSMTFVDDIGHAVLRLNEPPTEAEGKQ